MPMKRKATKTKKSSMKVRDLSPKKNPKGGRKAGEKPIEY